MPRPEITLRFILWRTGLIQGLCAALFCAAFLVSACGCDTLNQHQFVIRTEPATIEADTAVIADILCDEAEARGLVDGTADAQLPTCICYYLEPVKYFPLTLGARTAEGSLVVDLYHFHPGPGSTFKYIAIKRHLASRLRVAFAERLRVPRWKEFVGFPESRNMDGYGLTNKPPWDGICEVHHVAMSVQEVDCQQGASVYLPDYGAVLHDQFPHHGRAHFAEDRGYLYARHIRIYVCPDCTKAYDEWWNAHPVNSTPPGD